MIDIYVDGSAHHPRGYGPAGSAFVVFSKNGEEILQKRFPLKKGTNNYAELRAIYEALNYVRSAHLGQPVTIYSDSQYAVRCSLGIWMSDPDKKRNYELVKNIQDLHDILPLVDLKEVPRSKNRSADREAKRALEEARILYVNS